MLAAEPLITLAQAAALLPSPSAAGGHPVRQTVLHWVHDGVLVAGVRVRLETVKVGGRRYTSVAALERFAAAQSNDPAPVPLSPRQRERAADRGRKRFAAAMETVRRLTRKRT